jgi:small subunit ribosomal protein S4
MARYTGPRRRIVRRLGIVLSGLTRHTPDERPYPPGQHGQATAGRRRRDSEYGLRLREKQKLRYYYGVSETQLNTYAKRAARRSGPTGENLLSLLELRLDNVVFRLGFAPTIPAARQLITHGHIRVNGRKVSYPAYALSVGDRVEVRDKSRQHGLIAEGAERGPELALPSYLERSPDGFSGRLRATPAREDVPIPDLKESWVVEYYAR